MRGIVASHNNHISNSGPREGNAPNYWHVIHEPTWATAETTKWSLVLLATDEVSIQ